jgi:uncharacterized protein affecting Mg2+/Co2+ transport
LLLFYCYLEHRTVEGPGVVGLTPVIENGKKFSYSSQVVLESKIGTMSGHFRAIDLTTYDEYQLIVAPFLLAVDQTTPKAAEVISRSMNN